MEWNKENTLFFIQLIRERPELWDVNLEEYRNKHKKQDAYSDIAKNFGITKEEVHAKWTSLKGQYNREKKKVTGLKTGSGAADIYISKWFGYQEMADLFTCNIPQDSISNYNAISSQTMFTPPTMPAQHIRMPTPSPPAMPTSPPPIPTPPPPIPTPPPTTPTPPPQRVKGTDTLKKKRNSCLYEEALITLKAIKERKNKTPELDDEITTYGLYIAAQIRKFQPVLQSKLKLDIQSLLCKYEIENIECTSRSASSMSDYSVTNNLNSLLNDEYYSPSPTASSSTYSTYTYRQPDTQSMPTTATTDLTESNSTCRLPDPQSSNTLAIQSNSFVVISNDGSIKEVTGDLPDSLPDSQVVILQNEIVCPDADMPQTDSETKKAIEYLLKFN